MIAVFLSDVQVLAVLLWLLERRLHDLVLAAGCHYLATAVVEVFGFLRHWLVILVLGSLRLLFIQIYSA